MIVPLTIASSRRVMAKGKAANFLADWDHTDACATCPKGHGQHFVVQKVRKERRSPASRPCLLQAEISLGRQTCSTRPSISTIIFQITSQRTADCGIGGARKERMNDRHLFDCWRNRKTIAAWLIEEARRRGYPIAENSALDPVKAAFNEVRKNRSVTAGRRPPGKPSATPLQTPWNRFTFQARFRPKFLKAPQKVLKPHAPLQRTGRKFRSPVPLGLKPA